jgi:hypothetical protein
MWGCKKHALSIAIADAPTQIMLMRLGCGGACNASYGAIDQTPLTQRLFERHPKHSDSLGPKGFLFRLDRYPNRRLDRVGCR